MRQRAFVAAVLCTPCGYDDPLVASTNIAKMKAGKKYTTVPAALVAAAAIHTCSSCYGTTLRVLELPQRELQLACTRVSNNRPSRVNNQRDSPNTKKGKHDACVAGAKNPRSWWNPNGKAFTHPADDELQFMI